ncbi:MAG: suppressor of fused domain protein [Actinocrinis sp.]
MAKPPSDANKQLAQDVRAVLDGAQWRVINYLDKDEKSEIYVLHSTETPEEGLTTYCTIGLSDYVDDGYDVTPPLGVEIIAVSNLPDFGEVVSTAAFCVINSGYRARPGGAFPGVVKMHRPDTTVPNLMFAAPYLWDDDALRSRVYEDKTVAFLQALPISDAETQYLMDHGPDALGDLFEEHDPDFIDLQRRSIV